MIWYLGGFFLVYDFNGDQVFFDKVVELGDMFYVGFDIFNYMLVNSFNFCEVKVGSFRFSMGEFFVVVGILFFEFIWFVQLIGDFKYFNVIFGVMCVFEKMQDDINFLGMWLVFIDVFCNEFENFISVKGSFFSLGVFVDLVYEYFFKMYVFFGGFDLMYKKFYMKFMVIVCNYFFFWFMFLDLYFVILFDVLLLGNVYVNG